MTFSKLETALDGPLNKNAPVKLPPEGRKGLANAMWIIALVFGICELLLAISFWQAGHVVDRAVSYINTMSGYVVTPVGHLGFFYYLSVLCMAAVGALLLLATPGLKAMKKEGWNFLFYGVVVEAAVAVVRLFSGVDGGVGGFLGAAIGAVIGAYFLFQVRDYFMGAKVVAAAAKAEPKEHELQDAAAKPEHLASKKETKKK